MLTHGVCAFAKVRIAVSQMMIILPLVYSTRLVSPTGERGQSPRVYPPLSGGFFFFHSVVWLWNILLHHFRKREIKSTNSLYGGVFRVRSHWFSCVMQS